MGQRDVQGADVVVQVREARGPGDAVGTEVIRLDLFCWIANELLEQENRGNKFRKGGGLWNGNGLEQDTGTRWLGSTFGYWTKHWAMCDNDTLAWGTCIGFIGFCPRGCGGDGGGGNVNRLYGVNGPMGQSSGILLLNKCGRNMWQSVGMTDWQTTDGIREWVSLECKNYKGKSFRLQSARMRQGTLAPLLPRP